MPAPLIARSRRAVRFLCTAVFSLAAAPAILAQSPTPPQPAPSAEPAPVSGSPIAIIPIDSTNPDQAATVTGALEVAGGKAMIAASGSVTSGSRTTSVILPHRGVLRVCASTTVKLAADTSVPTGQNPGLLIAMDHGAIETSFATGRNADILLTPDFRILIGGPGSSELKVRLGENGDTCVDNPGVNAPYVVVTSLFEDGLYRVQPGQRVMFQHGSLREVVDQEKEPCGCPPPLAKASGNEFPLAQSEGLAPTPAPAVSAVNPNQSSAAKQVPPLVYSSPSAASQTAPIPSPIATAPAPAAAQPAPPVKKKKPGLFTRIGHFFKRIFGAE